VKASTASFALAASVLTGCTTTETVVVPLAEQLPASLLTCRDRPVPGRTDRQSDVARYIVDLDLAGADCRSKLAGVRDVVEADSLIEGERNP
jgi:hypothetical protein